MSARTRSLVTLALLTGAVLAACGGGGSSDGAPPVSGPSPAPEPPPPPPPPPPAPDDWAQVRIGGGDAPLYGCDSGGPDQGFTVYRYVRAGASGDGSRQHPMGSIQAAHASIRGGQHATICVEEGTYEGNIGSEVDDLSRGYRLVGAFAAGSGFTRRALDGGLSQVRAGSSAEPVLRLGNHGHITVDGFDLSGGLRGLYVNGYAAGRRLVVRNNRIHHNGVVIHAASDLPGGASENSIGGVVVSGSDVLVEYNDIHDNDGAHNGAGLNIGEAASSEKNQLEGDVLMPGSARAVVRYNRIHHNTLRWDTPHGTGVTLNMNALFQRNVVWANRGLKWDGNGGHGVGGGLIAQSPHATVTVADNWFESNQALTAGAAFFFDEATIGTAYNNVVVRNDGPSAICVDGRAGGDQPADRSYMTLVHNTVAWNSGAAVMVEDSRLRAYNNLLWHNGSTGDAYLAGGGALTEDALLDHNVMRDNGTNAAGLSISSAFDLEAADPFILGTLAPAGELSLGVANLRPSPQVGHDTLQHFAPAFDATGALAAPPILDAAGMPRTAGAAVQFGAYQRP